MPDLPSGSEFAGHRIDGLAGRGGMGVVYRAVHLALNRLVALKLLAPALADSEEFRRRFRHECEAAASLDHPNVIPIYSAGEEDGQLYVAMRYVEGTDLRRLAAEAPLSPARAADIVAQSGDALDAAHARGLVHRDVKPGNLLIEERNGRDHVFLTDFGLTKDLSGEDPAISRTGVWVGTVDYSAPEQIRALPVDARSDVYALGGVLYWAVTGQVPYPRDADTAKMHAHLNDPPPSLRGTAAEALDPVVARAMAKRPEDRYPSAGDLGRAARTAAGGRAPSTGEATVATGAAAPPTGDAPTTPVASASDDDATRRLPTTPPPPPPQAPTAPQATPAGWPPPPQQAHTQPPAAWPPPSSSGGSGRTGAMVAAAVLAVLLVAGGVLVATGVLSGDDKKKATSAAGPNPKSTPPPSGDAAHTPTNGEVQQLLQTYIERYGAENADGLGELFADDAVRRNDGDPPENRTEAIATYRKQFAQLSNPTYELSGLRIDTVPGAATVRGRYAINSSNGTVGGRITYSLAESDGHLVIKRLDIQPD